MVNENTNVDVATTQSTIDTYLNTLSQKYLANSIVKLSSTNTGLITGGITPLAPYANLTNRYFPTVATIPETSSNIKTRAQLGGYYIPSNLGASVYLSKSITYSLNFSQIQSGEVYYFIDPSRYNKGRGLTKTDQANIITHYSNLDWIKASLVSDVFNGHIVNTDTYQKFIPYQSAYETLKADSNGINNARYDFEFWTGTQKDIWDENNTSNKLNSLKYFDLQSRITNLLYTPGQELYSWNTDVFGNQYALYKPIITPTSMYASTTATGNLWVKTLDSTINPGQSALNLIYKSHINNTSIYSQLTSNNIKNFDVFFDTLVIELSSTILYEKITFNYDDYTIDKSLQNFQTLSANCLTTSQALSTSTFSRLVGTPSANAYTYFGGNWYDEAKKTITICTLVSATLSGSQYSIVDTGGLSSILVPVLYQLDLNNPRERVRIYPNNNTPATNFADYVYSLSGSGPRNIKYAGQPVFSYNADTNLFLVNFISYSA